jgi:hypothetical protein
MGSRPPEKPISPDELMRWDHERRREREQTGLDYSGCIIGGMFVFMGIVLVVTLLMHARCS